MSVEVLLACAVSGDHGLHWPSGVSLSRELGSAKVSVEVWAGYFLWE